VIANIANILAVSETIRDAVAPVFLITGVGFIAYFSRD
jgi:hypothetical protein